MIGESLSQYRVTARLGAGGMGEVYRATDTKLEREVAIKLLPAELALDSERLARFEREARLLAALNHTNIAHVYGFERAALRDGSAAHFLAMELVEGEDLAERLKRGAIPVDEALAIARQIAEALEEAHDKGIIHRDLKPANVKVTPDGKVKVLDFGLAKAYAGESARGSGPDLSQSPTMAHAGTQAGVILGTAAYMSPEQARGKPVDKRADIWAFGVVLYEMLTGKSLFGGDSVSDVLASVLKESPAWQDLPGELPDGVARVLRRCLEKDPRHRLHDIADARLELESAETPVAAGSSTAAAGPRAPLWRRTATGLLLLVLGLVLGAAAVSFRTPRQAAADVRFTITPPGTGGQISNVLFFPDGRRLLYDLSTERRLLVHDLGEFDSRPLPGTEGASRPFLSADGRWVGFLQEGKIRKIALDGGDPMDVCATGGSMPGAAWGPGGVILFSPSWTGVGLWRVDAAGGEPVELTKPAVDRGETGHFWPSFLPDGRAALFTIFGGQGLADSKVGLVDLDSGRYQVLFDGAAARYLRSGHILYYRGGAYRSVPFDAAGRTVSGPEITALPQVRRLSPVGSNETYASFADSGVLAYVEGDSTAEAPLSRLAWVSRDGRRQDLPFEARHVELSLAPDAARAAVTRFEGGQNQVYVYDLQRGTTEQVTREGQNFGASWHPDGRRLAFTSQRNGNFDLRWAPADGTSAPEALVETPADEGYWRWAPDGQSGVYLLWSPVSGVDIWRAQGDGRDAAPLLASASNERLAMLSADGKWLAYRSGGALYVTAYPSLAQRVLIAPVATYPVWSRSGRELFYVEDGRLKAVAYEEHGGSFQAARATTLIELTGLIPSIDASSSPLFDAAPDGRFLFLARSPGQPERDVIRVVLNSFEALRGPAPAQRSK